MKTKKIFGAMIAFALLAAILTNAVSAANSYTTGADELKSLELFFGTGGGYELDRAPTRAEAAVILVRLLGGEAEAKEKMPAHPFTDVADWASPYIGYLYENGLIEDISGGEFYPDDLCDADMFCAFVLGALGYSGAGGDFGDEYDDALDFAYELGLVSDNMFYYYEFTRGDCVFMMYNALLTNIKGTQTTLLEKLAAETAVEQKAAAKLMEKIAVLEEFAGALKYSGIAALADIAKKQFSAGFEVTLDAPALEIGAADLLAFYEEMGMTEEDLSEALDLMGVDFDDLTAASEAIIACTFTMVGEEFALEAEVSGLDYLRALTGAEIPGNIALYYTDGYIYADYMGEKVKKEYAYEDFEEELADSFSGIDIANVRIDESRFAMSTQMIESIEKTVSDKGAVYTINLAADFYYNSDVSLSAAFGPNKKLDSVNLKVTLYFEDIAPLLFGEDMPAFFEGYFIKIQANFKLTTGGGVSIEFPDFSGYIEADEDFYFDIPDIMP